MDYSLSGNPNTIYVDLNTASSGMLIVCVTCAFLFLAVWNALTFWGRWRAAGHPLHGGALDAKMRRAACLVCVGVVGCALGVGAYAINPNYRAEQAEQGARAVEAVHERFGLDARWEFQPYTPFDGQTDLIGKLFIEADGRSYPTRITPAEFEGAHGELRTSDETFVIEVLTDAGYVPISDFARAHGLDPAY